MTFDAPASREDAWRLFVMPSIQLLSLLTAGGDAITRLAVGMPEGSDPNAPIGEGAEWWPTKYVTDVRWTPHSLNYLVILPEARPHSDMMARWFKTAAENRFAFLQLFEAWLTNGRALEDNFSRAVRAVEIWHRTKHPEAVIPKKDFRETLKIIRQAIPENHWEVPRAAIENANALSLRDRLNDILTNSGTAVAETAATLPDAAGRIVKARNGLTHSGNKGDSLDYQEMYRAERILEVAMQAALLAEIGFDPHEIARGIQRQQDWKWLAEQ
jgi:hypothetical protein